MLSLCSHAIRPTLNDSDLETAKKAHGPLPYSRSQYISILFHPMQTALNVQKIKWVELGNRQTTEHEKSPIKLMYYIYGSSLLIESPWEIDFSWWVNELDFLHIGKPGPIANGMKNLTTSLVAE